MTAFSAGPIEVVRHTHTLGLPAIPIRKWGNRAWFVSQAVLMAVVGAVATSGAAVRGARSAINVGVGFACVPVAVAGLTSVWWGVLIVAPLLVGYDHLLSD